MGHLKKMKNTQAWRVCGGGWWWVRVRVRVLVWVWVWG
jgi:hypothetical protein